ncbi:MAG TPA: glycosyltransferase [bacterium]|nr:glycosyltransferase [bacterium]
MHFADAYCLSRYRHLYLQMTMKISVIIPAYNEASIIGETLSALMKADRPSNPIEFIVVNNASTDRTAEIASSFPDIRVVTESEKGLTKARQCGNAHAQGDILIYIDADTRIPKHLLRTIEEKFIADPKLVAMSGPYKYHDWTWYGRLILWLYHWTLVPMNQLVINRILNKGSVFYGGNFAVRKKALDKIGGFDTGLEFWSEDTQIGRRMSQEGRVRFFHRAYVYTSARRYYAEGFLRVLMRYIMNYFWDIIFHRPFTKGYQDVRSTPPKQTT